MGKEHRHWGRIIGVIAPIGIIGSILQIVLTDKSVRVCRGMRPPCGVGMLASPNKPRHGCSAPAVNNPCRFDETAPATVWPATVGTLDCGNFVVAVGGFAVRLGGRFWS